MLGGHSEVDPEVLFVKQEKIGKGSFGEVFKGWVSERVIKWLSEWMNERRLSAIELFSLA